MPIIKYRRGTKEAGTSDIRQCIFSVVKGWDLNHKRVKIITGKMIGNRSG
jgi:hypothetical protein